MTTLSRLVLPLALGLGLAFSAAACDGSGTPEAPTTAQEASPSAPTLPTTRAAPRDAAFSVSLPADLLVQAFSTTLMATSSDGGYRVFVEARKVRLLEALGQLKDELIGLGWEVTEERHFEAATLLGLGHGSARHRQERSVWLIQARGGEETLLCDGLARGSSVPRLGAEHRATCQTLTLTARSPE